MSVNNGGRMRLKILLVILGIVIIAFGIVLYYYGPYSEAARGGVKGKPTRSPTSSPTSSALPISPNPSPASPSPTTGLFSDDFSGDLSKWQVVYTSANIVSGQLQLIPSNQTYNSPTDTHAPLVLAGDTAWQDYVYQVTMKTVRQLRPSNPNPWEVGWIFFRVKDASNFYYFIQKTNGLEIGKLVNGNQQFIKTASTNPLTIGSTHTYKIALKGSSITVFIDGTQVMTATDSTFSSGKIGLYNEDAETLNDNVTVAAN